MHSCDLHFALDRAISKISLSGFNTPTSFDAITKSKYFNIPNSSVFFSNLPLDLQLYLIYIFYFIIFL